MRILRFILLVLVTLAAIGAAVLLTIDGNPVPHHRTHRL